MAASDIGDPTLDAALYGPVVPSFADMAPPPTTNQAPWDWLPDAWRSDDEEEQIRRLAAANAAPQAASYLASAPPSQQPPIAYAPAAPPPLPPIDPYASAPPIAAPPIVPIAAPEPIVPIAAPEPVSASPAPPILFDPGAPPIVAAAPSAPVSAAPPGDAPLPFSEGDIAERPFEKYLRDKALLDNPTFDALGNIIGPSNESRQIYIQDPVQAAVLGEQIRDARERKVAAETHELNIARGNAEIAALEADRAWVKQWREKAEQRDRDSTRLANTKIDTSGRFTTAQKVLGVIGAAIGGLVSGRTGSNVNTTLDLMNAMINRDIDAQKTDLDNARAGLTTRSNALIEEFRMHGDEERAEQAVREAHYKQALGEIDFARQNFARGGTTDLHFQAVRNGVEGALQKVRIDAADKSKKDNLAERKQANDDLKTRAESALAFANAAKARSEVGAANDTKRVMSQAEIKADYGIDVPKPMTLADLHKHVQTGKLTEEYKTAQRANDPAVRATELSVPGLVDDLGQPILMANSTHANDMKLARFRAANLVRKIDELQRLIEDHGYEPDFAKSPAWQRAQQLYTSILLEAKEQDHLGALSGSDIKLEEGKIGTSDPTQIRDTLPGISAFRHDTTEQLNTMQQFFAVVPKGRTVQRWEPPPYDNRPHEASPEEIHLENLRSAPNESRDEAIERELIRRRANLSPDDAARYASLPPVRVIESNEAQIPLTAEQQDVYSYVSRTYDKGAAVWQQQEIEELGRAAAGAVDDPVAINARKTLGDLVGSAHTGKLKALAKSALDQSGRPRVDETTTTRVR